MAGYDVDPVALRTAVNKLKDQRDELGKLMRSATRGIKPGELTANDKTTIGARTKLEERALGETESLSAATKGLFEMLDKKIGAYEATLKQYEADDEAAVTDASRIGRRS